MSGGPFLNIILSASASHPPLERAPELVQVVVVVPGDHGEDLVDAPATAGVRVDAGAVPVPALEPAEELERLLPPAREGLQRRARVVAEILPLLGPVVTKRGSSISMI